MFVRKILRGIECFLPRRDRDLDRDRLRLRVRLRLRERDLNKSINLSLSLFSYMINQQTENEYDDDDVVDDTIYEPVMVNDENYVHLIDDKVLYEHPCKFQVLEYQLIIGENLCE